MYRTIDLQSSSLAAPMCLSGAADYIQYVYEIPRNFAK